MTKVAVNKPYHHGDLRQSLIDAACEHLKESGADTLSLRALARKVGVSQTAPYRHFESKGALFGAIALYGFELLREQMSLVAVKHSEQPDTMLVEVGMSYLGFVIEHPEKYQLFFDSSLVDFTQSEDLMAAGAAAFAVLTDTIQAGIDQGIFIDRPVIEPAGAIWSSMHGMASLMMTKEPQMQEHAVETDVHDAMMYMANDPRPTLELFVNSIRRND
jgi:AcrR family transcriptional regulator